MLNEVMMDVEEMVCIRVRPRRNVDEIPRSGSIRPGPDVLTAYLMLRRSD
jgi:hypothetical protein